CARDEAYDYGAWFAYW
nr:immunoglobulin heavy chain junction region [Mus musculus]MBK4189727.1 immunoglobulin heavy chain junction region [Mus musculus]